MKVDPLLKGAATKACTTERLPCLPPMTVRMEEEGSSLVLTVPKDTQIHIMVPTLNDDRTDSSVRQNKCIEAAC